MPGNVLADAFAYLDDERTDISRLVSNLAERHQKLIQAEEVHKTLEQDLREKSRTAELKELALRQKELDLRRLGLKELRDFLIASRREWEEIREKAGARSAEDFNRLVSGIQARVEEEDRTIEAERESLTPAASFEVREGMEVVIARTGRRGRVLRRDKGGKWVVETETLRLSLAAGELRPAPEIVGPAVSVSYSQPSTIDPPVFELHLIGARVEEALHQVERQIDSALVHGLREFSIVHGKGEGILRTAIHEYLRGLSVVQDFRFSSPEEGGFGKTIVTLKE